MLNFRFFSVMVLSGILMLGVCHSYAQEGALSAKMDKPVNLQWKDTDIKKVLADLSAASGIPIVLSRDAFEDTSFDYYNKERSGKKVKTVREIIGGTRVSFDFSNTPIEGAVQTISNDTGIPIIVDPDVLVDDNGMPVPRNVSLNVTDMPLYAALEWLRKLVHLEMTQKGGIIVLGNDAEKKEYVRIYDVRNLLTTGGVREGAMKDASEFRKWLDPQIEEIVKEDELMGVDYSGNKMVVTADKAGHLKIMKILNVFREKYNIRNVPAILPDFKDENAAYLVIYNLNGFYKFTEQPLTEDAIKKLIECTISPELWGNRKGCWLEAQKGRLVVSASNKVHEMIGKLFSSWKLKPGPAPLPRTITMKTNGMSGKDVLEKVLQLSGLYYSAGEDRVIVSNRPFAEMMFVGE